MKVMARTLREKMDRLPAGRRARVEAEAERLHAEYLTLQDLRKAKAMTQVRLAATLGVQQATVAKYERQTDLLISTLASYVDAMGGKLSLVVEFPGKKPVTLEGLGDLEGPRRRRPRKMAPSLENTEV
jgi:DNA-binding XRE family transcriptional regulator